MLKQWITTPASALRILVLMLSLSAAVAIVLQAASAYAASPRQIAEIEGRMIRLGDLFTGLDQHRDADFVLGPAPAPGKDLIIGARTLMRIATKFDLSWRPKSAAEQIVIRRSANAISQGTIGKAIKDSLKQRGLEGPLRLEMRDRDMALAIPRTLAPTVAVENMQLDKAGRFFKATLVAPSAENPKVRHRVSGQYEQLMRIPVLSRGLRAGEIIGRRDIEWINASPRVVQNGVIMQENNLIGMTPRRVVMAGEPVRDNDVQPPQLVKRGDEVTLQFKNGPLELTSRGRALENGSDGDRVRVVNLVSKRTIEAFVTGKNTLQVY